MTALHASPATQRTVFPNGLTVLVRRDPSAPVVAIVTHVKAGYFDEPDDVVGIAHVLEHMYFKGTPRRGVGEIARATKAAGGYLNAGTIYDRTTYYTVLPASGFAEGLDVQADAYANSLIDADELRRELEVIIQEAKRKADNPPAVAVETLYALLHDRHRMRRWRIGTEPELRRLRREHVVAFYRAYYRPGNTILSIVGDIDPDDALRAVERAYGSLPDGAVARDRGPAEPPHTGFRYREMRGDVAQAQLVMGWRTPGTMDPDTPLLDVAAAVLAAGRASRLYRAVRERRLAASIGAHDYTPTELGVFSIHAEGSVATTADAAREAWRTVRTLRDDGPADDELFRARRLLEARWIRRLETMEGQATHFAEWEALGDWTLGDRYLERLLGASRQEVADAVRRRLDPAAAAVVVYRPSGAPEVAADAATMRALLETTATAGAPAREAAAGTGAAPSPPARRVAALEREEGGVRVYRSPEGIPILVRRKPGAPLVHTGVFALGGACDEPASSAGLTMLLARTALKGTAHRTAARIAEEAELLGGSIAASTGSEQFGWSLSVPAARATDAIVLLADVAQHPVIPEDALETERATAIAELGLLRDDMFRYPLRLATSAAFAGHPYGVPASGDERTLSAIDALQVRMWHAERLLGGPSVVVIVGDVDADEAAATAATHFDALRPGAALPLAPPAWPAPPVVAAETRETAQTALALAFPAPARGDPRRFAARLAATVASGLGGRLFDELRDRRSLAYSVTLAVTERRQAGLQLAYIATSPGREQEARDALLAELARLGERGAGAITEAELARAQTYAIGTHAIRQESGAAVMGDVLDAWLFGALAELPRYDADVRAVALDAVREVARECLAASPVGEGVVRGVRSQEAGGRGAAAESLPPAS